MSATGDVAFVTGSTDIKVNHRYSNIDLFNDTIYFGLVQEDGKQHLPHVLILSYGNPTQVTDLPITASNNFAKQWRYYTFTIPEKKLGTRLVQQKFQLIHFTKAFYAIAYYAAGTDKVQQTFFIEFSVTVDRATDISVDTAFKTLTQTATVGWITKATCQQKDDSIIKWCNLEFTAFTTPNLHFNENFILQQIVTAPGMNYYLIETEVWFTDSGLMKKATIVSINNSVPLQVIIQLKAHIV